MLAKLFLMAGIQVCLDLKATQTVEQCVILSFQFCHHLKLNPPLSHAETHVQVGIFSLKWRMWVCYILLVCLWTLITVRLWTFLSLLSACGPVQLAC